MDAPMPAHEELKKVQTMKNIGKLPYIDPAEILWDPGGTPQSEPQPMPPVKQPVVVMDPPALPAVVHTEAGTQVTMPEASKKVNWPLLLVAAVGYSLLGRKKISGIPSWVLPVGAAAVLFFVLRKKGSGSSASGPESAERQTYEELLQLLQADPQLGGELPADFVDAVKTEYSQPGTYNDNAGYDYRSKGWPGALMAVADAWKGAMKFTDETHQQLWKVFSRYANQSSI